MSPPFAVATLTESSSSSKDAVKAGDGSKIKGKKKTTLRGRGDNTNDLKKSNPKQRKKNKNRPKSRKARNKQFLMKRWKSQQQAAAERKQKAEARTQGKSELINAIGVDLATIQRNASMSAKGTKTTTRTTKDSNKKQKKQKQTTTNRKQGLLPWSSLHPGSEVSGKVIKLLPYGALIQIPYDIPGKTRGCVLLHESQMNNMKNKLKVGQQIHKARVVSLNRDKGTVNITFQPPPDKAKRATTVANLQVGDEILGKIVRQQPYGAFVDIGYKKRNALLHLSRMSMYKVHNITDHVQVGQTVQVRVLRMEDEDGTKNIAVSMLSPDNDAFVDRRDLQRKRMAIWDTVVTAQDDQELAQAKKQLLEVDRQIWDQFIEANSNGPKSGEV